MLIELAAVVETRICNVKVRNKMDESLKYNQYSSLAQSRVAREVEMEKCLIVCEGG